jgi:hypothetical protein
MPNQGEPQQPSGTPSPQPANEPIAEGVVNAESTSFKAKVKSTTPKMRPRITVVGAVQAVRTSYPDSKTGGPIAQAFATKYSSSASSPNEVARQVGIGAHKYGSLNLDRVPGRAQSNLYEEPAYVDSGVNVAKAPGNALVIGNDKNDETVKMGSYGPQNRKLDQSVSDANKIGKVLKSKQFSVTNLSDQTGQGMKTALNNAISSFKSDTSFVFYFSGHGTIEGVVGTDGKVLLPTDLALLVKKAIEANSDLVILIDACHAGIIVDGCRFVLLERAKERNKNNDKIKSFVDAAIDLARTKDQFIQKPVLELWKKNWLSGDLGTRFLKSKNQKDNDESTRLANEFYAGWFKAWNDFVDSAQTKINDTVQKGKSANLNAKDLTLKKFTDKDMAKGGIEQDQEKQIWAQLDSLDDILNLAASAGS